MQSQQGFEVYPAMIHAYGHGRREGSPQATHRQKRGGQCSDGTAGSVKEVLQLYQEEGIEEGGSGGGVWSNVPSSPRASPIKTKEDETATAEAEGSRWWIEGG
jgi:hypothetical protein